MKSKPPGRAVLLIRPLKSRPALLGFALISLSACATTSTGVSSRFPQGNSASPPAYAAVGAPASPGSATLADAEAALTRGNALDASARYVQAAAGAPPALASDYRLRAAELANSGGDSARADLILDQIPAPALTPVQQSRYRLLRAQTALARNDPARALRLLPAGDPGGDPAIAAALLLTRARAMTRMGDAVGATTALVSRERYLAGSAALAENREVIWTGLSGASLDSVTLGRAASANPVVNGWIQLAALARRSAPLQDYDAWRKRFPDHPGEDRLASLYVTARGDATTSTFGTAGSASSLPPATESFSPVLAGSGSAGLLLPASGPLMAIGDAVRAGFAAGASRAGVGEARVYDTSAGVPAALQRANAESAGVIVGPLRKEDVAALAQGSGIGVPLLALNYLDGSRPAPAGFYQFGLAPEDEARAAAEDAFARGLQRAVAMVPSSDWGNRILVAFQQRLTELGGRVVDSGRYTGDPQNWSDPIKRVLRFNSIDDKKKAAEARAKAPAGTDPQRRNDIDFVFIAGRAAQARVLWPLFRYYHADRLPIYATSAVFEGAGDSDLSGIRFCDAPWLLDNGGPQSQLAGDARNGRSLDNARLYAMGSDAFLLASRIGQNQLHPGDQLGGATGRLVVGADGAIHRGLTCAQMTSGMPFVLSTPSFVETAPAAAPPVP